MTPDVNVQVAESRNDHPHHGVTRSRLEPAIANAAHGAALTLQSMVIAGFLRLVTHPRVFAPWGLQPALGGEWLTLHNQRTDKTLCANDVPNRWLVAAVIRQGEQLIGVNADFRHLLPRGQFARLVAA